MTQTKAGAKKAVKTIKAKHGDDFYSRIGQKGGKNGHTGGFAANHELARIAGKKGGKKSRRTGVKNGQGKAKPKAEKPVQKKVEEKKGFLKRVFGGK